MDKNEVYRDLKRRIEEERLPAGQWLIEREVATEYGLSRTPVREVLQQLTNDGLLVQAPRKGFAVRRVTLEEVFEIFQAREAVEGIAARLACKKGNERFYEAMIDLRERLRNLTIDDKENADIGIAIGRELHNAIFEAVSNTLLVEFYGKLQNLVALTSNLTRKSVAIENTSREAHLRILDALIDGNEDVAEDAMREHLRATCKQIVDTFYPGMMSRS